MSYWFGYRVFHQNNPGAEILEGPFNTYEAAKAVKQSIRGSDMQKTSIFPANSREDAAEKMKYETWMN